MNCRTKMPVKGKFYKQCAALPQLRHRRDTNLAKPSVALKAGGKWNTYDIIAKGPHLVLMLNGTKTVDIEDSKLPCGFIALQASGGTIRFRRVRVRSL